MKTKSVTLLVIVYVLFHITGLATAQESGIVQFFVDPRMMLEGPYSDSKSGALDFVVRAGLSEKTHEIGFFVENFEAMNYRSGGVYFNKKINVQEYFPNLDKFNFLAGIDGGFIHRVIKGKENYSCTTAINLEMQYMIKEKFGISLLSNYRSRGDLIEFYGTKNPMIYSGYVGVFYKF